MSKKNSKKRIIGLLKQKELHTRVFSDDHPEVPVYGKQAADLIKKAGIDENLDDKMRAEVDIEAQKEFCKRLKSMACGKKGFSKSLDFYRLMCLLEDLRSREELAKSLPDIEEKRLMDLINNLRFCVYKGGYPWGRLLTNFKRKEIIS